MRVHHGPAIRRAIQYSRKKNRFGKVAQRQVLKIHLFVSVQCIQDISLPKDSNHIYANILGF